MLKIKAKFCFEPFLKIFIMQMPNVLILCNIITYTITQIPSPKLVVMLNMIAHT